MTPARAGVPIPSSTPPHSARPRPRPLPRHLPPPFPLRTLRTQALTAPDGSYVLRVRLPGVSSAASVAADVVNDRAVEITASPADGGGAYRLLHALPFRLPAEGCGVPPPAARSVKFSRKAGGVLTVTFDPPARAAAPTTEGRRGAPPRVPPPRVPPSSPPPAFSPAWRRSRTTPRWSSRRTPSAGDTSARAARSNPASF